MGIDIVTSKGEMGCGILRRNKAAHCGVCWKWNERLRILFGFFSAQFLPEDFSHG